MNHTNKEELMDNFATGRLSQSEMIELRQLIKSDPNFQHELDLRKDIADGVNIAGHRQLRKVLDGIHKDVVKEKSRPRSIWKMLLAGVAFLLGALAIFQFLEKSESSPPKENIQYASYYKLDMSTTRSDGSTKEDYLMSYAKAYLDKDYEAAINIINPHLDDVNNEIKLTTAIASLETDNPVLAMKLLDQIIATDDYYFIDHAKWYKALIYIEAKQEVEAKILLEQLAVDPKADHHQEAKNMLESM